MFLVILWFSVVFGITYLISPVLMYFRLKMSADPALQPFDPLQTPDPKAVGAFFTASRANMEKLGFQFLGYFTPSNLTAKAQFYMAVYKNPQTLDHAMSNAIFIMVGDEFQLKSTSVEFTSKFENDFSIDTNNGPEPGIFGSMPSRKVEKLPGARNSQEIYGVHRHLVGLYPRLKRINSTLDEDPAKYLKEMLIKGYSLQVPRGYLKLDEAKHCFRPTVKGAFLMTWRLLWPVKPIRKWALRRRARHLVREAFREGGPEPLAAVMNEGFVDKKPNTMTPSGMARKLNGFFAFFLVFSGVELWFSKTVQIYFVGIFLLSAIGLFILWMVKPKKRA
jgi:hypothetical protein